MPFAIPFPGRIPPLDLPMRLPTGNTQDDPSELPLFRSGKDEKAWDAFQLANRAMYMQRIHLRLQEQLSATERYPGNEELTGLLDEIEKIGYTRVEEILLPSVSIVF